MTVIRKRHFLSLLINPNDRIGLKINVDMTTVELRTSIMADLDQMSVEIGLSVRGGQSVPADEK